MSPVADRPAASPAASRRPIDSAWLLARLAMAYGAAAVLVHVVPLRTLARWAWRPATAGDPGRADRIVATVIRLRRVLPAAGRGDCLPFALVLYRELSRAGHAPQLVMGFERAGSGAGLEGHAWVEVDRRPVAESVDAVARYTPAAAFGPGGSLMPCGRG